MENTDIAVAEVEEQPLVEAVTSFHGNPHQFLVELLKTPEATYTSICASIGSAIATFYQWRSVLPNFRNTVDRIQSSADSLRNAYVQALFDEKAPAIGDAMVDRATSTTHKDGQRAGERILESVGVLSKPGIDLSGADTVDMIAIRLRMSRSKPQIQPASDVDSPQAIEAEVVDIPTVIEGSPPRPDHSVTGPSVDEKGHMTPK